jgi:hypothetical protein
MARRRSRHYDCSPQRNGTLQRVVSPRPLIHLPSRKSITNQRVDQDAVVQFNDPNRVRVPSCRTENEYKYEYEEQPEQVDAPKDSVGSVARGDVTSRPR